MTQLYISQERLSDTVTLNWTRGRLNKLVNLAKEGKPSSSYGDEDARSLQTAFRNQNVSGKHIIVVGSYTPWVEAILIAEGASNITTIEYAKIQWIDDGNSSIHSDKITTILPADFDRKFLENKLPKYDGVVSFSSIEHSGLGRYFHHVIAISLISFSDTAILCTLMLMQL